MEGDDLLVNLLEIKVFDDLTKDMIGLLRLDLSPLLLKQNIKDERGFIGWQPIYNTENGIQGELYVEITL